MRNDSGAALAQRILIAGGAGSGKSTLARVLGERTNLPVFHTDHIHWKSGWTERSQSVKAERIAEVIAPFANLGTLDHAFAMTWSLFGS